LNVRKHAEKPKELKALLA